MKFDDYPESLREALVLFIQLRRLAVPSENIFAVHAESTHRLYMQVKGGHEDATFDMGPFTCDSHEAFAGTWQSLCHAWNDGSIPSSEVQAFFMNSKTAKMSGAILMTLISKGIMDTHEIMLDGQRL